MTFLRSDAVHSSSALLHPFDLPQVDHTGECSVPMSTEVLRKRNRSALTWINAPPGVGRTIARCRAASGGFERDHAQTQHSRTRSLLPPSDTDGLAAPPAEAAASQYCGRDSPELSELRKPWALRGRSRGNGAESHR